MTGRRRLAFEIIDTDLAGRVGRVTVNGKRIATPCLLPVVHPVHQVIPASKIRSMGFEAVMTNSMIAYKRVRDDAKARGIQEMLGFEGVVMTDSGGYQVLEYGDLDVESEGIARFQEETGSDFAVTLDRPTGLSRSKRYARGTVEYSLKNALQTIRKFGETGTVWVGPIQGGLFPDLLSRSTRILVKAGFEFLALGSPTEVMENYMYADLVRMIAAVKKSLPYSIPLHLFGAGHPLTMALSVALGCDTFDSASYILFAREERYMTENGTSELRRMQYLPCSCPVCSLTSVRDLLAMSREERVEKLALHNLYLLRKEMLTCREAITEGRLWDLVEERASAHPRVSEGFAEMAKQRELLRTGTPFLKDRGLFFRSDMDEHRPELHIVSERLKKIKARSSNIALLSLRQGIPTGKMRSPPGMRTLRGKPVDRYRIHPQLGLYPGELDFIYPFTQTTNLARRADASASARAVRELKRMGYERIISR